MMIHSLMFDFSVLSSNIAVMKAQLDRLGCHFDWHRVSSNPESVAIMIIPECVTIHCICSLARRKVSVIVWK